MGNMSYCRFQNTEGDLQDCYDNMEEIEGLSKGELAARNRLIELCCNIAKQFGDEGDNPNAEEN